MNEIKPFPDQVDFLNDINKAWSEGHKNIIGVAVTGFGKTLVKAFVAQQFIKQNKTIVIFAHRDVLLSQISLSLADVGIQHRFICSKPTETEISNAHVDKFGFSYVNDKSHVIVASVLTWINRDTSVLAPLIDLWMIDESHHTHPQNSWGKCISNLINAKGLGVTATPMRNDKLQLGRKGGGVFDKLVKAVGMGELIKLGRLSPYRIYTVPSKVDLTSVNVTSSGDYNQTKLAMATDKIDITGDAVEHYQRLANGQQAITFCVNIEHANNVAKQFNDAGINSFVLSSKSKLRIRQKKEKEFRQGLITNLINVDLFSEGYNVPKCAVVIMLRKTLSYGLFKQQFGRMLRLADNKPYGILLDHVGNVAEHCIHGEPHDDPEWTLEPQKKKKKSTDNTKINSRTCPECFGYYHPKSNAPASFVCPYCGHAENADDLNNAARELQISEGTLVEYDTGYLDNLIKERQKVDLPVERIKQKHSYSPSVVKHSAAKNHLKRQEAQRQLRPWIQSWCEHIAIQNGLSIDVTQGEFERVFKIGVFKAQVLGERQALDLLNLIKANWSDHISINGVL